MPEGEIEVREVIVAQASRRDLAPLYIPGAIIIAGLLIALGLYFGLSHGGSAAATQAGAQQPAQAANIANVKTTGEPYIGNANAPVVMAFWSDWQCPYCKAWEVGGVSEIPGAAVLPQLITQYVNTGKLKIVFKDFQFLGPDSTDDAEYARAIWDLYPTKYFAWRTAMYNQQPEENSLSEADNKTHVEQVTASISGISISAVEAEIVKNKSAYDAAIAADEQEGGSFGITGTPGFIVGTTLIDGDQPLSAFSAAIDAQLK